MKFNELKDFDSSIKLISPKAWDQDILGITNVSWPKENHLIFIKSKPFLEQAMEESKNAASKKMGVVIAESLLSKLEEEIEVLKNSFGFLASSENIDLSISYLSKPFFQKMNESLNNVVDGRQMGSAEIHPTAWIAQGAFIAENVVIEEDVKIHPGCVIQSNSKISKGTEIFPNVSIYPNVSIGENCRIHANVVIGADGFGYNYHEGVHHKVWHMGGVQIGNDVELGAGTAVDAGTFTPTIIGDGCKLDNQVQVGHNCKLGTGVVLCGQVAIGGSTEIGDFTVFGGKAGTAHNLKIGKGCQIAGGALLNCSWPDGVTLGGHPARPLKEWMKGLAYVRKQSLSKEK